MCIEIFTYPHMHAHTSLAPRAMAAPHRRPAGRVRDVCDGAPPPRFGFDPKRYTRDNVVTDAMFHAPMFELNADAQTLAE